MKRIVNIALLLCFTLAFALSQKNEQNRLEEETELPLTEEMQEQPYVPEQMLPELDMMLFQDEGMIVDDGLQQVDGEQMIDTEEQLMTEESPVQQNLTRRQAPEEFSSSERVLCRTRGCLRGLRIRSTLSNNRRTLTYTFDHFSTRCRVMQFALDLGNCDESDFRVVGCRTNTGGNIQCRQIEGFENRLVITLSMCDSVSLVFNRPISVDRGTLVLRSRRPEARCDTCEDVLIPVCPRTPKCGNRILERGEDCDPPNSECCDRNCRFVSSRTVCRRSRGECDIDETCTGRDDFCPRDLFERRGTRCRCSGRDESESESDRADQPVSIVGPGKSGFGMCRGGNPFCFRGNNRCEF
jgi:hypothetical protein